MTPRAGVALFLWLAGAYSVPQVPAYRSPDNLSTFYLVLLQKGPAWSAARTPEVDALQQAHLLHLSMLAADGHVLITGPVADESDLRGLAILNAASLDEARAFEAADPAVKAGRLTAEILPVTIAANWYTLSPIAGDQPLRRFACVLLSAGPNQGGTADERALGDDRNLTSLWNQRAAHALVLAGSIVGGGARRGLLVYAVDDMARATALAESSPAVQAGRVVVDVHPWLVPDGVFTIVK